MAKKGQKKALTALQVQAIQPTETRFEVPAGPPKGLFLVVQPSGSKSWALRYRWRGRTRKLTLKEGYPDLGLAAARAEALLKLDALESDQDPASVQVEEVKKETPDCAKSVAGEWLKRVVEHTRTKAEVTRIINKELLKPWEDKLITEIKRPDVLRVIDAIVDRGAPVLANRVLSISKRFFRWTLERGYLDVAPTAGIRPPAKEQTRERVLANDELAEIWKAAPALGFPFSAFFQLLILTGQRRNEVAKMKWDQIDLENALWTLPREATKAGRIHDVPLSPAAAEILKGLPRFKGEYVLTTTSGKRPISGFSKAKVAIDKAILDARKKSAPKTKKKAEEIKGLEDWIVHDLRRTLTTWMADNGVPVHVLAAVLNHSPGSIMGITAVYARSKYSKEKRDALNKWAEFVLSFGTATKKATA